MTGENRKSVGISVSGKENQVERNRVIGADVGYEIEGEGNIAKDNLHVRDQSEAIKHWYQKPLGIISLSVAAGLIVIALTFWI